VAAGIAPSRLLPEPIETVGELVRLDRCIVLALVLWQIVANVVPIVRRRPPPIDQHAHADFLGSTDDAAECLSALANCGHHER